MLSLLGCPTQNNYTYLEDHGYCVKYLDTGMLRQEAATHCKEDGAHLLRIDSLEKQQHITHFLSMYMYGLLWVPFITEEKGGKGIDFFFSGLFKSFNSNVSLCGCKWL